LNYVPYIEGVFSFSENMELKKLSIKPQIKSQVSKHRNKINTEKKAIAFPIYHQEVFRKHSGKRS
jgi:hypothetical protein